MTALLKFDKLPDWFGGLFEPFIEWAWRERAFTNALIEQSCLKPNMEVLSVSNHTRWLDRQLKLLHPTNTVMSLYPVNKTLARVPDMFAPPCDSLCRFPDKVFDRVFSVSFFHHLAHNDKRRVLDEIYRVLRLGGELHIADWGNPCGLALESCYSSIQLPQAQRTDGDNSQEMLLQQLESAGFVAGYTTKTFSTVKGLLSLVKARKPI